MMSDKRWTDRTSLTSGWGRKAEAHPAPPPSPPLAGPELVKSDHPDTDPFADPREYEAVRAIMGRSHDACFLADDGMPYFKPWAYFTGAEAHPGHRAMTLHWPGARIEVKGENLHSVYLRLMTRRADIWRAFNKLRHDSPKLGSAIIHSIRVVLEDEDTGT